MKGYSQYYVQSRTEARILIRIEISNIKRNTQGFMSKDFFGLVTILTM